MKEQIIVALMKLILFLENGKSNQSLHAIEFKRYIFSHEFNKISNKNMPLKNKLKSHKDAVNEMLSYLKCK